MLAEKSPKRRWSKVDGVFLKSMEYLESAMEYSKVRWSKPDGELSIVHDIVQKRHGVFQQTRWSIQQTVWSIGKQ